MTKPRQLSCVLSIAYGDFRADFREIVIVIDRFYIADWVVAANKSGGGERTKSSIEARMSFVIMGLSFNVAIAELGRGYAPPRT
jgi:hypothetical protein